MINITVNVEVAFKIAPRQWVTFAVVNAAVHTLCVKKRKYQQTFYKCLTLHSYLPISHFVSIDQKKMLPIVLLYFLWTLLCFVYLILVFNFGLQWYIVMFLSCNECLAMLRFLFNLIYNLTSNAFLSVSLFQVFPFSFPLLQLIARICFNIILFFNSSTDLCTSSFS